MNNIFLKKSNYFALFAIFLLAVILRFNSLGSIPNGLYQDETTIGYNAYSVLTTGKDEYGKSLPLYFKSFGDYKLPVYIYLTALSIGLFGLTEFAVRFPSALFGSLSVLVIYFLVRELTKKESLALLSALFLSINPWHLHFSRAGFEVNVAAFFILFGTLLFFIAIRKNNNLPLFIFSLICFVLATYSYNVTRVLAPLFFGLLILFNLKDLQKIKYKHIIISLLVLLAIPYFFSLTTGSAGTFSNLIFGARTQEQVIETRSYLGSLPSIFLQIFYGNKIMLGWGYLQNIVAFLSPAFFFISGSQHGNHGIGNVGVFYIYESLFIFLGLVMYFVNRDKKLYLFIAWLMTALLLAALSREVPHATRGFLLVIPLTVFSAYGCWNFLLWVQRLKHIYKIVIYSFSFLFISYAIIFYMTSYYVRFPLAYAEAWRSEDKKFARYLKSQEDKYDQIIIAKNAELVYTSLLFYQQVPPSQYHKIATHEQESSIGYNDMQSFGKYRYKDINWDEDLQGKRTLFVTANDRLPKDKKPIAVFLYPRKTIVLTVDNDNIVEMRNPIAYQVYSSDEE